MSYTAVSSDGVLADTGDQNGGDIDLNHRNDQSAASVHDRNPEIMEISSKTSVDLSTHSGPAGDLSASTNTKDTDEPTHGHSILSDDGILGSSETAGSKPSRSLKVLDKGDTSNTASITDEADSTASLEIGTTSTMKNSFRGHDAIGPANLEETSSQRREDQVVRTAAKSEIPKSITMIDAPNVSNDNLSDFGSDYSVEIMEGSPHTQHEQSDSIGETADLSLTKMGLSELHGHSPVKQMAESLNPVDSPRYVDENKNDRRILDLDLIMNGESSQSYLAQTDVTPATPAYGNRSLAVATEIASETENILQNTDDNLRNSTNFKTPLRVPHGLTPMPDTEVVRKVSKVVIPMSTVKELESRSEFAELQRDLVKSRHQDLSLKEQTKLLDLLSKENFDLKLKVAYLSEQRMKNSDGLEKEEENIQMHVMLHEATKKIRLQNQRIRELNAELDCLQEKVYQNDSDSVDQSSFVDIKKLQDRVSELEKENVNHQNTIKHLNEALSYEKRLHKQLTLDTESQQNFVKPRSPQEKEDSSVASYDKDSTAESGRSENEKYLIEKLQREKLELRLENEELFEKLSYLEIDCKMVEDELQTLRKQSLSSDGNALRSLQAEMFELREHLLMKKRECLQYEYFTQQKLTESQTLKRELDEQLSVIHELKMALDNVEAEKLEIAASLDRLLQDRNNQSVGEKQSDDVAVLHQQITSLQSRIKYLESKEDQNLFELRRELEVKIALGEEMKRTLEQQLASAERRRREAESAKDAASRQKVDYEAERGELKSKIKSLQDQMQQPDVHVVNDSAQILQKKLDRVEHLYAKLQEENEKRVLELDEVQSVMMEMSSNPEIKIKDYKDVLVRWKKNWRVAQTRLARMKECFWKAGITCGSLDTEEEMEDFVRKLRNESLRESLVASQRQIEDQRQLIEYFRKSSLEDQESKAALMQCCTDLRRIVAHIHERLEAIVPEIFQDREAKADRVRRRKNTVDNTSVIDDEPDQFGRIQTALFYLEEMRNGMQDKIAEAVAAANERASKLEESISGYKSQIVSVDEKVQSYAAQSARLNATLLKLKSENHELRCRLLAEDGSENIPHKPEVTSSIASERRRMSNIADHSSAAASGLSSTSAWMSYRLKDLEYKLKTEKEGHKRDNLGAQERLKGAEAENARLKNEIERLKKESIVDRKSQNTANN